MYVCLKAHHVILPGWIQDQTYNIGSPNLRDGMLCRIHLQSDDPDVLKHDAERDQL